jgi:adenine/guanine phosphoribosyltransferase-like PRPP-binding protein
MTIVSEAEFSLAIRERLQGVRCDCVMGPGRSGAIAAVYASHILGVPFLPYNTPLPSKLTMLLIVDTARQSGNTLRKMLGKYPGAQALAVFTEPPRVRFWYEVSDDATK